MGELGWLLLVIMGAPLLILFGAGYLLQRRQTRLDALFGALPRVRPFRPGDSEVRCQYAHCWEVKKCSLAERDQCPAYNRSYLPCWLAVKLARGGQLDTKCLECVFYEAERVVDGVPPAERTTVGAVEFLAKET